MRRLFVECDRSFLSGERGLAKCSRQTERRSAALVYIFVRFPTHQRAHICSPPTVHPDC